ncbi:hypothetical protein FB45DRAFT_545522 [Roridomyces roridus]|uniref:Uncharacterized protein n=1 Tax=Roridomyces roridus TaxID=1738132 RepID=A0AAD7BTZ7_9AGAR|nr:hypothetical protein FB45DRAFT_545522 [Roridomyces roridus]
MAGDIAQGLGAGPYQPNVSRRTSRGFFSRLFSKTQQTPTGAQPMLSSHHPFDSISLTSPTQRSDPAFSRDPSVHLAHPALPHQRDTSASASSSTSAPAVEHKGKAAPIILQWNPPNHEGGYYTASNATQSTLNLPPSEYSSSSSHSPSPVSTPGIMPAAVDSPLTETFEATTLRERPASPPPEYDLIAEPRPGPFRNDSAPELRRIEAPGLPHRSATAPPIPESRPVMRRRPQPYDLDRIDELDESNPLGVAMHHEGPFQAIASALKASSAPRANRAPTSNPRTARAPKIGGSLGIIPGQIFPHSLQYYQPPPVRPSPPQDYSGQPQASTSYLPPQQSPRFQQDYHGLPEASTSRLPPPQQFVQEQRFVRESSQWEQQTPYIPPQTQYDPIDDSYYAEDSAAYGGIEEESISRRDRRSAPPAPHAQPPPNVGPSRRFSAPQNSPQPPGRIFEPHMMQNPGQLNTAQGQGQPPPTVNSSRFSAPQNSPQPPGRIFDPRVLQSPSQLNTPQGQGQGQGQGQPPPTVNSTRFSAPQNSPQPPGRMFDPRMLQNPGQLNTPQGQGQLPPTVNSSRFSAPQNSPQPPGRMFDPRMLQNPGQLNTPQGQGQGQGQGQPPPTVNSSRFSAPQNSPQPPGRIFDPHTLQNPGQLNTPQGQGQPPPTVGSSRFSAPQNSPQPLGQIFDPRMLQNPGQLNTPQVPGSRLDNPTFNHSPVPPPVELRRPMSHQPAPPQQQNHPRSASADVPQQRLVAVVQDRPQSVQAPSIISSTATSQMRPRPHHVPKHLVMPTPLQRNVQLPAAQHQSVLPQTVSSQAQPTRAQTITMVQDKDGGRQLLRKRSTVMEKPAPAPPPPLPPVAPKGAPVWRGPYMAPPPTVSEAHAPRPPPPAQDKKRHKRLSKRRTDI